MPAFATVELGPVPLSRSAAFVGVYRYYASSSSGTASLEFLPHVRVLNIELREGAEPGIARFRYILDRGGQSTYPRSFEEVLSVDTFVPGVVGNDERLVVMTNNEDGSPLILFDGFAQVPELFLSPSMEDVGFIAYGVAIRAWDQQVGGARFRDADDPNVSNDRSTDLNVRFNPNSQPNATPEGADGRLNPSGPQFPVFLDPLLNRDPDPRRYWSLAMAVKYLCYIENQHEAFVRNPGPEEIDSLLDRWTSLGGQPIDPSDPSSYQTHPIEVSDYIATGKSWPDAVMDLISAEGFGMVFRLETGLGGEPMTRLELFRHQDGSSGGLKDLMLQVPGSMLDPSQTNLAEAHLARDVTDVANEFEIDGALTRYEASFILAPGFSISEADASSSEQLSRFSLNHLEFEQNREKYRLYVVDETGEGHWDWLTSEFSREATSLSSLFGDEGDQVSVKRRRVPIGDLFTTDSYGRQMKATLSISTDYEGPRPGIWDGSGTWQKVGGGFELLRDRLGIWISVPNPNGWNIQSTSSVGSPFPSGVVRGVEDLAKPGSQRFTLRLTCVVEGDRHPRIRATRRPSSPVSFPISRRIDATRRYHQHVIAPSSEFNSSETPVIVRDDTIKAMDEARARRLTREAGQVAGRVTIPRFTSAYRIGDRIRSILGRNLSLRTNAGAPPEEGEFYPTVVGLVWNFDGQQETILQLSDHRANLA